MMIMIVPHNGWEMGGGVEFDNDCLNINDHAPPHTPSESIEPYLLPLWNQSVPLIKKTSKSLKQCWQTVETLTCIDKW